MILKFLNYLFYFSLWTVVQADFVWTRLGARDLYQWTRKSRSWGERILLRLCDCVLFFLVCWWTFCATKLLLLMIVEQFKYKEEYGEHTISQCLRFKKKRRSHIKWEIFVLLISSRLWSSSGKNRFWAWTWLMFQIIIFYFFPVGETHIRLMKYWPELFSN